MNMAITLHGLSHYEAHFKNRRSVLVVPVIPVVVFVVRRCSRRRSRRSIFQATKQSRVVIPPLVGSQVPLLQILGEGDLLKCLVRIILGDALFLNVLPHR